jgi:hypothetical protein
VEKPAFKDLIKLLRPGAKLIKADTVGRDILTVYEEHRRAFKLRLSVNKSKYSFTSDIWSSPSMVSFMAVTIHWVDELFNLQSALLDMVPVKGIHSGENIAAVFVKILDDFAIGKGSYNYLLIYRLRVRIDY